MVVADDVVGNNRILGVLKHILHCAFSGLLHRSIQFLNGGILLKKNNQVNNRTGGYGYAHCHAVELALQLGDYLTDSLGGTSGGGDDGDSTGSCSSEVLVGLVEHDLVVCIGMDGGHQTAFNAEVVLQDLGKRSQAVGGAGSVGIRKQAVVDLVVVYAANDGLVNLVLGGNGEDDFLGTSLDVILVTTLRAFGYCEYTSGFDSYIDSKLFPGQFCGIAQCIDRNGLAINDNCVL